MYLLREIYWPVKLKTTKITITRIKTSQLLGNIPPFLLIEIPVSKTLLTG